MANKIGIVTGGSSGIGKAIIDQLLTSGHQVINISRSPCVTPKVINIKCDLSVGDYSTLALLLAEQISEPSIIHLVHNAFPYFKDSVSRPELNKLNDAFNCAVKAPMFLNSILLQSMLPGSSILYMGSTLSLKGISNNCTYITLKHAMIGMLRATVQDTFGMGINSFCICPGFTDTPMLSEHVTSELKNELVKLNSFNRLISPNEIASIFIKLKDEQSINGSIIDARLGQYEN
jgi:NAD(P)-dependent dehydrogenase (short-subunit alcohol dehydrogenase family)